MEHRIEGNKEKLIRNCITFLLFGFALLTMIFIGNKKEIMLFIYSGICSVMFILIILYKFKTTPVEIIISDISSKFYITNFSAQMKVFEINNNDIRRVQAFYKNKKPNYINIIYLDCECQRKSLPPDHQFVYHS